MLEQIKALPFDELRELNRDIIALIQQKRQEAVDRIKEEIEDLGLTQDDFARRRRSADVARKNLTASN